MAEYRNYDQLKDKQLTGFDIVYFGTERYYVRNKYIAHSSGCSNNNERIFIDLGINKQTFCEEHYGYKPDWGGVRPRSQGNDYPALTRCVLALYKELDRQVDLLKTSKFKVGDEVIITDWGKQYTNDLKENCISFTNSRRPPQTMDINNRKNYRVEGEVIKILPGNKYLIKSEDLEKYVVIGEAGLEPKDYQHSNEQYINTYVRVNNELEYKKAQAFYLDKFPDREYQLEDYSGLIKYMRAGPDEFGAGPMFFIDNLDIYYKDITLEVLGEQTFQVHVDKASPAGDPTSIKLIPFNPSTKPDMENLEQLKFASFAKANGKKIIEVSETLDEFKEQLDDAGTTIGNIYGTVKNIERKLSMYFDDSNKKQTAEQLKECEHALKVLSGKEFTEFFKAFAAVKDFFKTK